MIWRFEIRDYSTSTPVAITLRDEPVGWDSVVFNLRRDRSWHGISFDFTSNNLKFFGDGYEVLKAAYEAKGIEANSELRVYQTCDDMPETLEYIGQFLYLKYRHDYDIDLGIYITMDIQNAGPIMTFKNRYDQKVDLDSLKSFDSLTNNLTSYAGLGFSIDLPSKGILKQDHFTIDSLPGSTDPQLNFIQAVSGGAPDYARKFSIPFGAAPNGKIVLQEFNIDPYNNSSEPIYVMPAFTEYPYTSSVPDMIRIAETSTYHFACQLRSTWFLFTYAPPPPAPPGSVDFTNVFVELWYSVNGVETVIATDIFPGTPCPDFSVLGHAVEFNVTVDLALNKGDIVSWYLKLNCETNAGTATTTNIVTLSATASSGDSFLKYNAITYVDPTPCKAYLINEVMSRVTEAVTNDDMRVYSDLFGRVDAEPYTSADDGCGSQKIISKGTMIRRVTPGGNDPFIAVSMKDCFEAMDSVECIGMGVEEDPNRPGYNMVRVERFNYFYNDTVVLEHKNIPKITYEIDPTLCLSIFKTGYAKYEGEEFNGIDEFLTQRDYRMQDKSVKNTVDKICDWIASGFAWEITRRKNTSTKDWRFDNDIFLLCTFRSPYGIKVEQGADITAISTFNIIDPDTAYNIRISPARNALRHMKLLFSQRAEPLNSTLFFMDGKGNIAAQVDMSGDPCATEWTGSHLYYPAGIIEGEDLILEMTGDTDVNAPIFSPLIATYEYPMSMDDYTILKSNIYGKIGFSTNDVIEKNGWLIDLKYSPNDGLAELKLLTAVEL